METKTLSKPAMKLIQEYLELPFSNEKVSCPYFNNRRAKVRGGLRVLIGKGTPKDIVEEARLITLREKIDITELDKENLKKFLVDHNLGIDCSGLAFHVLNTELKGRLKKQVKLPYIKNPLRKLLAKLRTVENVGVHTLAHESNSKEVELKDIKPGDLVIILQSGTNKKLNHILIIHQVDYKNNDPKTIHCTHSFQWSVDGKYNHGARQCKIRVIHTNRGLLEQEWTEQDKTGSENGTYTHAKQAEELKISRLTV